MLSRLEVQNFRSIETSDVRFGPITILFGPTSSGKSTLLYALLALRNFIINPNQAIDGFLNLGFQNLGGFDATVFNHNDQKAIGVAASFDDNGGASNYGIRLAKTEAEISTEVDSIKMNAKVPIPYGLNQSWPIELTIDEETFTINWNGFACTTAPKAATPGAQSKAVLLAAKLNAPVESIKAIDVCPHRRGFFKPSYTPVPLTPNPTGEDEVATLIINDQNSPPRISIDTVEIFDRDFRTYTPPGTATTFFQTTEQTGARVPGLLVNDGFGVNQIVYMLAKIHRPGVQTVFIEEPEVHLHPTVIRKFARVIARLASDDGKQFIFTTHSEQFLLSVLGCVAEGVLQPEQLSCYHVSRNKKKTEFKKEDVSKDGQISGGLASFMEAELEDIKTFLKVPK